MKQMFLNRPLTDLEESLRSSGRCIACGAKSERIECLACWKARNQCIGGYQGRPWGFGAARASMSHEMGRRMGYDHRGAAPEHAGDGDMPWEG